MQRAERHKNVFRLLAQHHGGAIDGQQVGDIELSDELHADFAAIDLEIHSLKMTFQDACPVVGHLACGIGLYGCTRVLHHEQAVLVVEVRDGEGGLRQHVEEGFFRIAVVLEGLVVIQMVAREIGEQSTGKLQPADALLGNGMAGALHEGIVATGIDHSGQQAVQFDGIGRGVRSGDGLVLDVVAHRRQQATPMPHLAEHII